ncbi:hypothetical protein [Nostoc cycadae]|uniref:ABC transporter permease n=1 Tax=Nostoc cycadae WK-1 TaxID=1861711 RepID=A0A2H6LN01_9NOSO|nr:hypothetical protein [Nostoc cycadae]GBE94584.1 ABC transporter permease [Nostoc cycadae WK-1]
MNNKITHTFQQIFFTVIFLTLLSGGSSVLLASQGKLLPEQTRVFEICNTTWNMGIGAIFGLLGSRTTNIFQSEQKQDEQ